MMAALGRHVVRTLRGSRHMWSVCSLSRPVIYGHPQPIQPIHTPLAPASFHTTTVYKNQHVINIQDEEDFNTRVMNSDTPVVVDFHAGWCGPCKLLGPRLESLITAKSGSIHLAKVDIDENSDLAIKHGVEAVPTVLGVKNGKIVDKFVGLKDDAALETFIANLTGE